VSSRAYWIGLIREQLKTKSGITLGVTLKSSVRFAGRVTAQRSDHVVELVKQSSGTDKSTYVDLDEVAAIEVL